MAHAGIMARIRQLWRTHCAAYSQPAVEKSLRLVDVLRQLGLCVLQEHREVGAGRGELRRVTAEARLADGERATVERLTELVHVQVLLGDYNLA